MSADRVTPFAVLGGLLAAGLVLAGGQISRALLKIKASERFVTVRGLAEREAPANLVLWPIVFSVTGDELVGLQASLDAASIRVATFLKARGFEDSEFSSSSPRVTDFESQGVNASNRPVRRYAAEQTMTLRSGKVDAVMRSMQGAGELLKSGVALKSDYGSTPTFVFTALDTVKPAMIVEATKDARRAAEPFANDSGSRVGAIRRAQQGYFTIEDRDAFSPEFKKIRVVTTVDYVLED